MTSPGPSLERPEPSRATRWGVISGLSKADLEDLWWVERVTDDPAWVRRTTWWRTVPQLAVYAVVSVAFGSYEFLLGASIAFGAFALFGRDWLARRHARGVRNLHGIGDKRSFWADWPASLYFGFNVAMIVMIIGVFAVAVGWIGDVEDREPNFAVSFNVDCDIVDTTMQLEAHVHNPTDAPQRVQVDFRYVEAFGGDIVTVPTIVTLSPGTWQEVVGTTEVGDGQGCFGVSASATAAS